ncbi:MAG: nitroreductase family protein [Candidatus Micrarchaeia archaeon]|jgi:nitroreductase
MESFLGLAKRRKITYEFSEKPVPETAIRKILEAGRWAPSAHNAQPWRFIVVKNPETIRGIVRAAYYGNFHTLPSVAVLISLTGEASGGKNHRGMVKGEIGNDEAMMTAAMPALMMILEAEDIGIGSCLLSLDEKKLGRMLNLGSNRAPIAVGLGHDEKGSTSAGIMHRRKPLSELVKKERL